MYMCVVCVRVCGCAEDSEHVRPVRSTLLTRVRGVLSGTDITTTGFCLWVSFLPGLEQALSGSSFSEPVDMVSVLRLMFSERLEGGK